MSSVTGRIREIKQPRGGFLKPSAFGVKEYHDSIELRPENIHPSIIGMSVDYMTRFMLGTDIEKAFKISILGAKIASFAGEGSISEFDTYINGIKGNDKKSIINACKAVTYDVYYRNLDAALNARKAVDTNPDSDTIYNISVLIDRNLNFWSENGPVKSDGFTFKPNGYTDVVETGDGDYLSADILWDLKCSKKELSSSSTLQLLMYYIMGKHSGNAIFKDITKVGVFNPRLNKMYSYNMDDVPRETLLTIESEIIGYYSSAFTDTSFIIGKGFNVGERVIHWKYGCGTVIKTEEGKNDTSVTVNFDDGEKRIFLASFAKLRRIQ